MKEHIFLQAKGEYFESLNKISFQLFTV